VAGRTDIPDHVRDFQRGLFPILVEGDADAFRRYLGRWEDVIGDTGGLSDLPPAEVHALMARLLRRPQLYNLPAWPADLEDTHLARADARRDQVTVLPEPPRRVPEPAPGAEPAPPEPPVPTPAPALAPEPRSAAWYQLDMITGEFVPVSTTPLSAAEAPAPYEANSRLPQRRRRRRTPPGMVQLTLWNEGNRAG
jgi:hypothetical protein